MFRSRRTDAQEPQIVTFEGAVGSSGADAEPAVVIRMTNYDRDTDGSTNLAEIEARDAHGDAVSNGFGNVRFKTSSGNVMLTRLILTHDGRVGVGTETPSATLEIAGDLVVSGALSVAGAAIGGGGGDGGAGSTLVPAFVPSGAEPRDLPNATWRRLATFAEPSGENPLGNGAMLVTALIARCQGPVDVRIAVAPETLPPFVLGQGHGRDELVVIHLDRSAPPSPQPGAAAEFREVDVLARRGASALPDDGLSKCTILALVLDGG